MPFVGAVPFNFVEAVVGSSADVEFRWARALGQRFTLSSDNVGGLREWFSGYLGGYGSLLVLPIDGGRYGLDCFDAFALNVDGTVLVDGGGDYLPALVGFFGARRTTTDLAG